MGEMYIYYTMIWVCEAILAGFVAVSTEQARTLEAAINGPICMVDSPKLCENTRFCGKMAHYWVFLLYFVRY